MFMAVSEIKHSEHTNAAVASSDSSSRHKVIYDMMSVKTPTQPWLTVVCVCVMNQWEITFKHHQVCCVLSRDKKSKTPDKLLSYSMTSW